MTADSAISIRGLRTQFGRNVIHDGVDLDVVQGEVMGIVGASGTGKSVLMRAVIGLVRPTAGSVRIFGEDRTTMSMSALKAAEKHYGVLFQDGALFSSLTVAQNVMVPMKEHTDMSASLMAEIAAYKIAMSGLPHDACAKYPSELSGGMRESEPLTALDDGQVPVIPSKKSGIQQVLATAPELLERAVAISERLVLILDDRNVQSVSDTLANLSKLTGTLANSSGQIERLIADSQTTFTSLREAADGVTELTGGLNSKLEPIAAGAQDVITDVQKTVRSFNRIASQLELVVDENRDSIRDFSSGGLYELSQFIAEGRVLISALTRLSGLIERDPARFFFGDNQKGFEAK